LSVVAVAAVLRQFDVRLYAIDIVSARKRHVCEAVDPSAAQTVDDRPAGVQHGTWLCYGMDPQRRSNASITWNGTTNDTRRQSRDQCG
jgi:hypothetical protein